MLNIPVKLELLNIFIVTPLLNDEISKVQLFVGTSAMISQDYWV